MAARLPKSRGAVMRSAHRTYRAMNWRAPSDWPFGRCLSLAHAEIAGRRDRYAFAAAEAAMRRLLDQRDKAG
jgi:hypothetical protein